MNICYKKYSWGWWRVLSLEQIFLIKTMFYRIKSKCTSKGKTLYVIDDLNASRKFTWIENVWAVWENEIRGAWVTYVSGINKNASVNYIFSFVNNFNLFYLTKAYFVISTKLGTSFFDEIDLRLFKWLVMHLPSRAENSKVEKLSYATF